MDLCLLLTRSPQTQYASCSHFTWGRRQTLLKCCSVSSHLIWQLHTWKLHRVLTKYNGAFFLMRISIRVAAKDSACSQWKQNQCAPGQCSSHLWSLKSAMIMVNQLCVVAVRKKDCVLMRQLIKCNWSATTVMAVLRTAVSTQWYNLSSLKQEFGWLESCRSTSYGAGIWAWSWDWRRGSSIG